MSEISFRLEPTRTLDELQTAINSEEDFDKIATALAGVDYNGATFNHCCFERLQRTSAKPGPRTFLFAIQNVIEPSKDPVVITQLGLKKALVCAARIYVRGQLQPVAMMRG